MPLSNPLSSFTTYVPTSIENHIYVLTTSLILEPHENSFSLLNEGLISTYPFCNFFKISVRTVQFFSGLYKNCFIAKRRLNFPKNDNILTKLIFPS